LFILAISYFEASIIIFIILYIKTLNIHHSTSICLQLAIIFVGGLSSGDSYEKKNDKNFEL